MSEQPQAHDLLVLFDGAAVYACDPAEQTALDDCLRAARVVVVRRGHASGHGIPVGVRGATRAERYAGFVASESIAAVRRPESLRVEEQPAQRSLPALQALFTLQQAWVGMLFPWGPVGSVGFALATGLPVIQPESDLDLLLRADERLNADKVAELSAALRALPCRVDVQVRLPGGFVALEELTSSASQVLLRTVDGVELIPHPLLPMPANERARKVVSALR